MKVTIAILCSKDHSIRKCLASIPNNVSIIVMLNNPDEYVERVVKQDKRVTVCRLDESNLGLLRQTAIEYCKTPGIFFMDSDCILTSQTVKCVERELNLYEAVSVPMRYRYYSFETKVVSKCRRFTTPDDMLFMPAAFRIDVQDKIGGYLFDRRLAWGEDSDQRRRLKIANIPFGISNGYVFHKALTINEDARSAFRLGRGNYIQIKYGITKPRTLLSDLSIIKELRLALKCACDQGIMAGLYHLFIWRTAYKCGYWKEIIDANRNRNNRAKL